MTNSTVPAEPVGRPDLAGERNSARVARRREIWGIRRGLYRFTTLKRVRLCGWAPQGDGVAVRVSSVDGHRHAGIAGVQTCGSYWACPVCSEKIAFHRRDEIDAVARWWADRGGRIGFVTLTVRHTRFQSLVTVWDAVSAGWGAVTSGGTWKAEQAVWGSPTERVIRSGKRAGETVLENRIRTIRAVEVTYGDNGWHVHVHALLLLPGWMTRAGLDDLAGSMFSRWSAAVVSTGLDAPTSRHGVDARLWDPSGEIRPGEYLAKTGLGAMDAVTRLSFEAATGMRKSGRRGNLTPFGLLGLLVNGTDGDHDLEEIAAAWSEWERGSHRRRAITFSPGLRDDAGLVELTDEEVADEEVEGVTVATIDNETWREIRRHNGIVDLLEAWEASHDAGRHVLAAWISTVEGVDRPPDVPRLPWQRSAG